MHDGMRGLLNNRPKGGGRVVASPFVGISGWNYPRWRGVFYPPGLLQRDELRYAAERMTSIEINGSFYSLQRSSSWRRWRDETPDDFVFAVKGSRFITHMKRLAGIETPLANFFASGLLALGPKLGPVLWQLPPTLGFDAELFEAFLDQLPRSVGAAVEIAKGHDFRVKQPIREAGGPATTPLRHAVEVRHESFRSSTASDLAERYATALVVADSAGRWPVIEHPTADFMYLRLHGASELYVSGYTDDELDRWAAKAKHWMSAGLDTYVYFDNDAKVYAPRDAIALLNRLR
jgi:uncharacterized protein YecE (DUF72 family)